MSHCTQFHFTPLSCQQDSVSVGRRRELRRPVRCLLGNTVHVGAELYLRADDSISNESAEDLLPVLVQLCSIRPYSAILCLRIGMRLRVELISLFLIHPR